MIPGLADAHVHLLFNPADPLLFLANGVTAVRDMGGPTPEAKGHKTLAWDDHLALRSRIAAGEVLGPTLYAASSIHEAPSGAYFDRRLYVPVKNEVQALATLREAEEAGFDYYKIYNRFPADRMDDIKSNPWSPYLPESTRKIWSNGLRGFSKRIAKQVPGYSVLPSQHMEDFEALFQALHRAGAPIAAGSDSGTLNVIAGASLIDELTAYVRRGMTPWEALRTATSEAAHCFQDEGTFGVIAPGARADFLLLDQNPLEDITNLGTLDTVVLRGTVYPKEELLGKLDEMARGF
jgi:imidazolonepropionase-like amidohydrolase